MREIGEVEEREEGVFEWTVREFMSLPDQVGDFYVSPTFSFTGVRWYLKVYPNGQRNKSDLLVDVFLSRLSPGPPIELDYSLGLKSMNNKVVGGTYITHNFEMILQGPRTGFMRHIVLERQSEFAPSGHLTFVCRLKHPPPTDAAGANPTIKCAHCKESVDAASLPSREKKCLHKPIKCPDCSDIVALTDWYAHECESEKSQGGSSIASESLLTDEMLQDHPLLHRQNFDVVVRVEGREFKAHRVVLTARSPVFASLFRNDTKGHATALDVEDCSPSVFSELLYFLYCQKTDRLSEANVLSILAAARKYGVTDLKTICLEFMKEKFDVQVLDDTVAAHHSETEPIELAAA